MRVPLSWLREVVEVPQEPGATPRRTAEAVAASLVRVGLEEEGLHAGEVSGPLVVGRVEDLVHEPQKNGKTIAWCRVDVGDGTPEGRGIVCGAPNLQAGDLVVVALPGCVLPGGFAIAARKTYGHVSDGMICSAAELGLGDDGGGIVRLPEWGLGDATVGGDAIGLLGLDDPVVEVNVTPDRGYCLSVRGIGRELAHGSRLDVGSAFRDPADGAEKAADQQAGPGPAVVFADTAPLRGRVGCDRFVLRAVRGVDATAPSPFWLRRRLQQVGMRPVSLIVDATNYVMLLLGQPLHAFDAARVNGTLTVRRANPGERLRTLDGTDRALHVEDLVIADAPQAERAISLAGVMGGHSTEIRTTDDTGTATTDVLVEAAHWDPITIARTARRHKLVSEAGRRFERGTDPAVAAVAVDLVVDLLVRCGGGTPEAAVTDVDHRPPATVVLLPVDLPRRLTGADWDDDQVRWALEQVGCGVEPSGIDLQVSDLRVTVPSWRPDLTRAADLVEEVARLLGYDTIPSVLPVPPPGRGLTATQRLRRNVARAVAHQGLVEVLSYPFVSPALADDLGLAAGDERRRALAVANPLSAEQPLLRTSVLDSLFEVVRRNLGRGQRDLALFEIGLVTHPAADPQPAGLPGVDRRPDEADLDRLRAAVPPQPRHLAAVLTGAVEAQGWWGPGRPADWTDAVAVAHVVAAACGVQLSVTAAHLPPWHPGRGAALSIDGVVVGHAGEVHPAVLARLDLPARAVAVELDLDAILAAAPEVVPAGTLSTYPVATQDVALLVPGDVSAAQLQATLVEGAGDLVERVALFDRYTGDQIEAGLQSLAFRFWFRAPDRTLTAAEASAARESATELAAARHGAQVRGG